MTIQSVNPARTIQSINPATEQIMKTFDYLTPAQVNEAVMRASRAFEGWRKVPIAERGKLMRLAGSYLRKNKARFAALITSEMGKPILEAEAEIDKCSWNCDFYAENASRFLRPKRVITNASQSYVAFEPLGVVLAIMPWNYPFWQVMRFLPPALMAGNVALLKHASNVPQCALAIEEIFRESGFPVGTFQTLLIPSSAVDDLIADPVVSAVTLTGSDVVGAKVAEASGRNLKKAVLELGGSDPFIILADADLKAAAETGARARNQNAGQSCIAAKRFIVEDKVANEFEKLFTDAVAKLRVGDPSDRETQVGPMARNDLRKALDTQVKGSVKNGAKLLVGGYGLERKGYFYSPTILTNMTPEMPAFKEETFGPVAAVIRVRDADDAIRVANNSEFGLGASLWTGNVKNAKRLAHEIQAGAVFINGMVASDPRLPFGGVKRSGYGRELSEFGIREFVNVQTVWVGPANGPQMPKAK